MFTNLLNRDDRLFDVEFSDFAKKHYLKQFVKKYPGRQWQATWVSIENDLKRLTYSESDLQKTQQIDEIWHEDQIWIAKYDFKIAQTRISAKKSGNRCLIKIDNNKKKIEILTIYHKDDLPKNKSETQFLRDVLKPNDNELL